MMYIECDVFHFHGMYLNGIYGNKINEWMNEIGTLTIISTMIRISISNNVNKINIIVNYVLKHSSRL